MYIHKKEGEYLKFGCDEDLKENDMELKNFPRYICQAFCRKGHFLSTVNTIYVN